MIREKDMGAIINWFDHRKDDLYKFAWTYLKNSEDIQDVFYQIMLKVQTDFRKQKKNPDFEKWVIGLFLEECKRRTQADLDDALVLTYVLGLSQNEVSEILGISGEAVQARLHKGIQRLSGVKEGHYLEKFIDYLSRSLNRPEKIELEIHLHTCQSCQTSLASFQNTIYSLIEGAEAIQVPEEFLEPVIANVMKIEEAKRKKRKKRTNIGVGIASSFIVLLLIAYVTNGFAYMYYSWLDWQDKEDEQLLSFLKSGIGEPLNLIQESNGVKLTIKSAVADEFQTLIYYEVENLEGEEQYGINFWNGVYFEDEFGTFDQQAYPINHLSVQPLESEGAIFKGKLSLLPISADAKTIKLNISRLQKIKENLEMEAWMDLYDETSYTVGNWRFEIPIKMQDSTEYPIDEKITVDGIPMEFTKLIMAPTATVLQYSFELNTMDRNFNQLFFEGIETKAKTAKPIGYGWNFPVDGGTNDSYTFQSIFDSLYFDKPKEALVRLNSLSYYINDLFIVDVDMNQAFPQTFEYLGSEISIDKVELGLPTTIEVSTELTEGRKFESIDFEVLGQNKTSAMSSGISNMEGVLVDRAGKKYDPYEYNYFANMDLIDQPRHYQTKVLIEAYSEVSAEEIIPGSLQINGYQSTTYLDEVIHFDLK